MLFGVPTLAFLLFFTFSASRETAVRGLALISVAIVVTIPVTRLADPSLRPVVPSALVLLTLAMVIKAPKIALGGVGPALVLQILISAIVTYVGDGGSSAILLFLLNAVVICTAVVQGAIISRTGQLRWLAGAFVWLGVVLAGYSVAETTMRLAPLWRGANIRPSGDSIAMPHPFIDGPRAQATLGHPLPLAMILLIALTILVSTRVAKPLPRVIAGLTIVIGIIATGSRNAMMLIALIILFRLAGRLRSMRVAAYVLIAILSFASVLTVLDTDVTQTGSYTHRIGAIQSLGRLVLNRPPIEVLFGSGAGSVEQLYTAGFLQSDGLQAVDNQYVLTTAVDGVVGLFILLVVSAIAVRRAQPEIRLVIAVMAIQGMLFDFLGWPSTGYVFWLVIGVALSSKPLNKSPLNLRKSKEPANN